MLGKSVGLRGAGLLITLVLFAVTSSCAHNVSQDKKTGNDGKSKSAKAMTLENGEAKATGIVTYPGGDRVDWRVLELPEKKRGSIEFKLTWAAPRPGLQLAFDVFDEWNTPLVSSSTKSKKRARGKIRTASLPDAKGKYFIRVYAVGRGDAGKYKLTAEFKEAPPQMQTSFIDLEIPDPPKLAAVPEHVDACDDTNFDIKKPECKAFCPSIAAPPGWPACTGKCPNPPDINNDACHATMPCPTPPDRRVKKCPASKWPKCPDFRNPDPANPNCDNAKAPPVRARIMNTRIEGNSVIVIVNKGEESGVTKEWRGQLLRGDTETPIPGGEFTVVRTEKKTTTARIKVTADVVNSNPFVKLSPP